MESPCYIIPYESILLNQTQFVSNSYEDMGFSAYGHDFSSVAYYLNYFCSDTCQILILIETTWYTVIYFSIQRVLGH